jgi:hypothetical protein
LASTYELESAEMLVGVLTSAPKTSQPFLADR